jgi:Mg/Co/Ni transporter MgtE
LSGRNKKTLIDFESKKTIHFNITREAHAQVRMNCFKHKLSMQELFEEIGQKIAAESPDIVKIMEDLSTKKRDRKIKSLSKSDAESIFSIIENENPLSEKS